MKISLNWLKEYVPNIKKNDIFIEELTSLGLEVASIVKTKKDTMYAKYQRVQELMRIQDSVRKTLLDSMQKVLPRIKRDSLSLLLKMANLKNKVKVE